MTRQTANKRELQRVLSQAILKYRNVSYSEWWAMHLPVKYDTGTGLGKCHVEIDWLERDEEYVHIQYSAESELPSWLLLWIIPIWTPITDSVIYYKDGRVDGPRRGDRVS